MAMSRKQWEEIVWSDEYKEWMAAWNALTTEEKYDYAESFVPSVEWTRDDNQSIDLMRASMALRKKEGIKKFKPEYRSRDARNELRYGSATKVNVNKLVVEAPIRSGEEVDEDLNAIMRWPEQPLPGTKLERFDRPSWYDTMATMVSLGRHISIEGPPSVGKDTAVEQLAAQVGMPLVTIGGDGGFRTRDLTGGQQMVSGTSFFDVGEYVAAAVNGWWVLLTEVNAADPSALMYINRQLAAPYVVNIGGKTLPVHPNFRLFVTYNHGLVGTKPLPQSFKDRFFSIKESFFTLYGLTKRMKMMTWSTDHEYECNTVVKFGINMWDAYERGQMRYQITTRRLRDAIDLLKADPSVDVKYALNAAVLGAIDSPIEAKAAMQVLTDTISSMPISEEA